MCQYAIARGENDTIEIRKEKTICNLMPNGHEAISRRELMDFIDWLRNKEKISFESRVEIQRTLFRACPYSVTSVAKQALKTIRNADSAEEAYGIFAAELAKAYTRWKSLPGFGYIYEEDLTEYILSLGFSETDAESMTACIENRRFKGSVWHNDARLSQNFRDWANASGGYLRSRDYIPNLFRLEYLKFCHKNTLSPETAFTVSEHSTRGTYNGYGYLTSRLMGASSDNIVIGYRDNYGKIDKEKLITLAELFAEETAIPEVWIRNMNEDRLTVVRRTDSCKHELPNDDPIPDMLYVGSMHAGENSGWRIGICINDNGTPHFHMTASDGKRLAVSLDSAEYYRHNAEETDLLTREETAALCEWLHKASETAEKAGVSMTNYQNLCILWNQNTPFFAITLPHECPDYSQTEDDTVTFGNRL